MKSLNRCLIFMLACVLCFCGSFVFVSAADNGVITVGDAEGYPGDIVAIPISVSALPSNGFAAGTFVVSFGENLEYVNTVQCDDNYGTLTFGRPSDANADKNSFNILCFSGLADKNYSYTRQMVTVYFRVKSNALPNDDVSKNAVSVSTTDSVNKNQVEVGFDCVAGYVGICARSSELGDKLVGHSLTLEGEISLNFHVSSSDDLLANDAAFVEYTINGTEPTVITEKLSDCTKDVNGNLVLSCQLPAPMWSRTVTARVSDGNGNYGDTYTYSVKNYAMYMLSGNYTTGDGANDSALKELCVALLNYGGYSQKYFSYFSDNEADLANGNIVFGNNSLISELVSDEFDPDIKADSSARLSGECDGIAYAGVNVAVDAATAITHYFNVDGKASDYVFTLTSPVADDAVLSPYEHEGMIAVNINNIPAAYLDVPYTITATSVEGDGGSISVTYSVRSYMAHNLDNPNEDLGNLIRAMYLYSEAADSYFGK